jgi:hypothetical protein
MSRTSLSLAGFIVYMMLSNFFTTSLQYGEVSFGLGARWWLGYVRYGVGSTLALVIIKLCRVVDWRPQSWR